MDEHTAKAFDADLKEIAGKIESMAGVVAQQIENASEVLGTGDRMIAQQAVTADAEVDRLQREVEEKVS